MSLTPEQEAQKALNCLYIVVYESVAKDVATKVHAWITTERAQLAETQAITRELLGALEAWERFAAHCHERNITVPLWASELNTQAVILTKAAIENAKAKGVLPPLR